jgi:CRISPR-associated protein Cas5d
MIDFVAEGDRACFTRPESRADRVSYPVITPSAAAGLIRSVFWKPEIRWMIREVQILKPLKWGSRQASELMKPATPDRPSPDRMHRHTEFLKDVAYRIKAEVKIIRGEADYGKYLAQFERRLERGQYYDSPYLGLREFPAYLREPDEDDDPIDLNLRLRIFQGWEYERSFAKGHDEDFDGRTKEARFVTARIEDGVYTLDRDDYDWIGE